ncbi:hypothetical protein [Desulfolithobacter sp.]
MKLNKTAKNSLLTGILALGLATTALAMPGEHYGTTGASGQARQAMMGPGMMGGMMGPGMMGGHAYGGGWGCNPMMTGPGTRGALSDQQQKFLDQTVDLRKQMMEKRFEYMEAARNPKTTPQDLAAIEKDMLDLRTKMMERMNNIQ